MDDLATKRTDCATGHGIAPTTAIRFPSRVMSQISFGCELRRLGPFLSVPPAHLYRHYDDIESSLLALLSLDRLCNEEAQRGSCCETSRFSEPDGSSRSVKRWRNSDCALPVIHHVAVSTRTGLPASKPRMSSTTPPQ